MTTGGEAADIVHPVFVETWGKEELPVDTRKDNQITEEREFSR